MCSQSDDNSPAHPQDLARRNFLKFASAAALSFGFLTRSQAADTNAPPKPENVLPPNAEPPQVSPDEALTRLIEGNARFVAGHMTHVAPGDVASARHNVATGQTPFAVIVGCSDSRVAPEIVFDEGLGDIFVIRTAGEVVDDAALGSIEYAVEHLGSALIAVLGHQRCGAVSAAVAGAHAPGHIATVLKAIEPAVEQTKDQSGDPVENAVHAQALNVAKQLQQAEPILAERVRSGKLKIVAARYDLDTGKVEALPF